MKTVHDATATPKTSPASTRTQSDRRSVLIIEDDPQIGRLVAIELAEAGYDVEVVSDGSQGLARFEDARVDLVVLDLMLPGINGLDICRHIRARSSFTPIVVISAKAAMSDIVRGLELGADDYLTKPFDIAELMARIQALFRRIAADQESDMAVDSITRQGALVIDTLKHEVCIDGEQIDLTAKEFDLLHLFARHPGRTFNRGELLSEVWGVEFKGYEHTVNTHINRLRRKIRISESTPSLIETVWGVGYRFAEQAR